MISTVSFILLIVCLLIHAFRLLTGSARGELAALSLLAAAAAGLIFKLILRSIEISFFAVTNTYEALLFLTAAIGCITFFLRLREYRSSAVGKNSGGESHFPEFAAFWAILIMCIFLALASSPIIPDAAVPPVPALRSHWLVLHVGFAFIGEGFFAVSFVTSILFLFSKNDDRRRLFDRITYTTIAIGYPVFTAGALIFGAVWAQFAWGRYWGWDPKENWALVTWLTYTVYLHVRFIRGKKGTFTSLISILGFIIALFTFFGVNYLISSLHSYV